jgi:hypothetical protein
MHIVVEKSSITPLWEDVEANYDESKEPYLEQDYPKQLKIAKYQKTTNKSNPLLNTIS